MIQYLNTKYGAGSKIFLEILSIFRSHPHRMLHEPHILVKKLITETFEKLNKERVQPFEFRNQNMGDMLDLINEWWIEIIGGPSVNLNEILTKDLMIFALKKRIIIDEKELDTFLKDLLGTQSPLYLKYSDF